MKEQPRFIIQDQSAFTLVEVLIALAVFTVGILSVNVMQMAAINGNSDANRVTTGTAWAAERVELLMSADPKLPPGKTCADDDGINPAYWFCDDIGPAHGVAGLDAECCPGDPCEGEGDLLADGCISEDMYDIYWNVVDHTPILNLKTVRVIVDYNAPGVAGYDVTAGRLRRKQTVLNYIKAGNI